MTYDELISAVITTLKREEDDALISMLPTYFRLVESEVNRNARVIEMEKRSRRPIETTDTGELRWAYGWPNDYLGLRVFRYIFNGSRVVNVELLPPEQMTTKQDLFKCRETAIDTNKWYYTTYNDYYSIMPIPPVDQAVIELIYYGSVPPLGGKDSLGNVIESNWLSEKYPDIYLYGACKHSQVFIFDDERLPLMGQMYAEAVAGLKNNTVEKQWSGTTPRVRVRR